MEWFLSLLVAKSAPLVGESEARLVASMVGHIWAMSKSKNPYVMNMERERQRKLRSFRDMEALRDQAIYAQVVKEAYERAKEAAKAREAAASDRQGPSDVAGS